MHQRNGGTTKRKRSVLLKIGKGFELEVNMGAVFVRIGRFERYWNTQGLPSH